MNELPKQPITCRECGFSCNRGCVFADVDYKTRTGVCKNCAEKAQPDGATSPKRIMIVNSRAVEI